MHRLRSDAANAFAELEGSAWDWYSLQVDAEAWRKICEARTEFNKRVEGAVRKSRNRGEGKKRGTHDVVVGVAAFPAVSPAGRSES